MKYKTVLLCAKCRTIIGGLACKSNTRHKKVIKITYNRKYFEHDVKYFEVFQKVFAV